MMRAILSASMAAGALLLLAGTARAESCALGCAQQLKACAQSGRVGKLGCRSTCRANPADIRSCLHACVSDFLAVKQTCGGDFTSCLGTCSPTPQPPPPGPPPTLPPPNPCLQGCGQALATCAKGVITQSRTCVAGCATAPNKIACLFQCARQAETGGVACGQAFRTCATGCRSGSPSGAFVDVPLL